MANDTMTFREAYGVLQEHAETLRNQTEPNIDDLLSIVEESVNAYRVCKDRIDAVEKALEKALTDVADAVPRQSADESAARPTPPARGQRPVIAAPPAAKSGFDDMEDDIPFLEAGRKSARLLLCEKRLLARWTARPIRGAR